jgi:hypothetical protein
VAVAVVAVVEMMAAAVIVMMVVTRHLSRQQLFHPQQFRHQ